MVRRAFQSEGRGWRQGLALWLLLLSILTHAVVPAGSPLVRTSGSAFGATTAEVAIAPKRNTAGGEQSAQTGSDQGSAEGAGTAGDPPARPAASPASPPWPIDRARPPFPAYSTRTPDGGAASFSARAPPSI